MQLAAQRIRLIITSECNIDCFYCHNEGQRKGTSYMSPALVYALAEAIPPSSEVREVTVSGGEPLLHPDVAEIVRIARSVSPRATLVTNGVLADTDTLERLTRAGLTKLRLGLDSLRLGKPRPSPGYLSHDYEPAKLVDLARSLGLMVELNSVLTNFNRQELPALLTFALERDLSIKLFEHVDVEEQGAKGLGGKMGARPHVPVEEVLSSIQSATNSSPTLRPTFEFGEANLSVTIGETEIRYCRYLCPFGLCWVTGTRLDAEGYVYSCMTNRGLDRVSQFDADSMRETFGRATVRPCRSAHTAGSR